MSRELWIVTGLSGAGKSLALKCLEDLGFWCVDNLPAPLTRQYIELDDAHSGLESAPRALGLRGIEQLKELEAALAELPDIPIRTRLLFLECDESILVRRYSETRRRHPLIGASGRGLARALRDEREALGGVREKADYLIDTTSLSPHTLMARLESILVSLSGKYQPLLVHVQSFGFKNGLPADAEWVWDVRFLPNPHYIPELREHSGVESVVSSVVFEEKSGLELVEGLFASFIKLLRIYARQGRRLVNIGIGCTGGQHRSVAVAERLAETCLKEGFVVSICHRDVRLSSEFEEAKARLMRPDRLSDFRVGKL